MGNAIPDGLPDVAVPEVPDYEGSQGIVGG